MKRIPLVLLFVAVICCGLVSADDGMGLIGKSTQDTGARYVFISISSGEFERPYILDSQTGRLWAMVSIRTGQAPVKMIPVEYAGEGLVPSGGQKFKGKQ